LMFTSRTQRLSNVLSGGDGAISVGDRAYFQSRLRSRIYELILSKFIEQQNTSGLTKAILARRIERAPAVITRYLSAPSNLTIETISDLLLGISGEELDPVSSSVDGASSNTARERSFSSTIDLLPAQSGLPEPNRSAANDNVPLTSKSLSFTLDWKNAASSDRGLRSYTVSNR
jgi:hypothetical protein